MRVISVVVVLGLSLTAAGATGANRADHRQRIACPPSPARVTAQRLPVVLAAAEKVLARQTTTVQGVTYRLTPRWAPIDFLASISIVGNGSPIDRMAPGLLALHNLAASECGFKVAELSWAVRYSFPTVIAGQAGYAFFTKTPSGWRFWGNWCGAGESPGWRKANCD